MWTGSMSMCRHLNSGFVLSSVALQVIMICVFFNLLFVHFDRDCAFPFAFLS